MGKHEHPPFRMVIEGGKLVPVTAYDAERLDTYRRGTEVRVTFTEEKDRPLVRKWWAILGLVVKQCDVPWQNKDQASEAIKLALGIVNLSKTVHGQYMQYPKSLTELTEPELEEAVEQMMALIQRMTGIDPETLKKEAKIEVEESSAPPADAAAASTPPAQNPMDAAAPPSAADPGGDEEAGASVPVEKAAHGEPSAPASELDWLKTFARAMVASIGPDEAVVVNQSKGLFVEGLSEETRAKARSVTNYCRACSRGEIELSDCLDTVAGVAGCDVRELR